MENSRIDKRSLTTLAGIGACIIMIMTGAIVFDTVIAGQDHYYPDYPMIDLMPVIYKAHADEEGGWVLENEDYKTIFYQTGLGKPAVEQLLRQNGGPTNAMVSRLERFQNDFFSDISIARLKFGIITYEEIIINEEGDPKAGFQLAPLNNGDIFVSKSTLSLGWRHGHGAIVTDAKKRKTVEAVLIGYDSVFQNADKWQKYPSFIMLRMKEDGQPGLESIPERAAAFARANMEGVPYGLLTGILEKSPPPERMETTQCAHIVWYPYLQAGCDLDSDGGWMVTPQDVADSEFLEVVQIYGIDPKKIWP